MDYGVIEIYAVPGRAAAVIVHSSSVTFLGTNETDRKLCMESALAANMGNPDAAYYLSDMRGFSRLLHVFRIDDGSGFSNTKSFASVVVRTKLMSDIGAAPRMEDAWVGVYEGGNGARSVYGFIRSEKPDITMGESLRDYAGRDELDKGVLFSTPAVKQLIDTIASRGECWPGGAFSPNGVGLYIDESGTAVRGAVVVDWSDCVAGRADNAAVLGAFLENYKAYLTLLGTPEHEAVRDEFAERRRALTSQ